MISWASRMLYSVAEIFDAFILVSEKFNNSLNYRRHWKNYIRFTPNKKTLWIHGASVGELEDLASFFLNEARLKKAGFDFSTLVLTSSSVSARTKLQTWGEKYNLPYSGPIPPESKSNCQEFLKTINPSVMILSHTDIWPTLLEEASKIENLELLWLPTKVKELGYVRKKFLVKCLTHIGLRLKGAKHPFSVEQSYIGNPRIDRIIDRISASKKQQTHVLKKFNAEAHNNKISILLGSAWKEDADFIARAIQLISPKLFKQLNFVVIPHDPQNSHEVAQIKNRLNFAKLILEEGVLLEAYQGFSLAFVGGAFRTGLHNVLEPALWGVPVICGPNLEKQPEANQLMDDGQLFSYSNPQDFAKFLECFITDDTLQKKLKTAAEESCKKLEGSHGANDRLVSVISSLGKA